MRAGFIRPTVINYIRRISAVSTDSVRWHWLAIGCVNCVCYWLKMALFDWCISIRFWHRICSLLYYQTVPARSDEELSQSVNIFYKTAIIRNW